MEDRDGLKILLRTSILDDPNFGGQRAERIFHIIEHHDRAAGRRNVLAELLIPGIVRLIAGKVHVVRADREPAHVLGQRQSSVSLGQRGEERRPDDQHQHAQADRFQELHSHC